MYAQDNNSLPVWSIFCHQLTNSYLHQFSTILVGIVSVHVDNVGAIWLSNNRTTSDRTKHIDIRTSFVKEYQEDGKIIIKFVKSEENDADIFTKNTSNVIFSNHQRKLVWDKTNVESEVNQELDQSESQQERC